MGSIWSDGLVFRARSLALKGWIIYSKFIWVRGWEFKQAIDMNIDQLRKRLNLKLEKVIQSNFQIIYENGQMLNFWNSKINKADYLNFELCEAVTANFNNKTIEKILVPIKKIT